MHNHSRCVHKIKNYICFILGLLCSNCTEDYSVSLDLQKCLENRYCGSWGVAVFVVVCKSSNKRSGHVIVINTCINFVLGVLTVILSLLVLFFDIKIPNSLKGVIFFAQVCNEIIIANNSFVIIVNIHSIFHRVGHWCDIS